MALTRHLTSHRKGCFPVQVLFFIRTVRCFTKVIIDDRAPLLLRLSNMGDGGDAEF